MGRGAKILRLDADTFLGLEPQPNSTMASDYLTPEANLNTSDLAFSIRKLGGFSYQEFAAPLAQLKEFAPNGPDLSYDFFTRAEVLYALINGDVLPLRLGHHFLLDAGVSEGALVHDLQNHDEITFQLFELGSHGDFQFEGQNLNGMQLSVIRVVDAERGGDETGERGGDPVLLWSIELIVGRGLALDRRAHCVEYLVLPRPTKWRSSSADTSWSPTPTPWCRGCSASRPGTSWAPCPSPRTPSPTT